MKTLGKTNLNFSKATAVLVLLLGLVGCTKDRSSPPVASLFEPPSARHLGADADITPESQGVIAQTSFESQATTSEPQWHVSLPAAVAEAQSGGKLILADFTGSDWCSHCVTLKKKIFNTPEFKSWAADNVVLLELDYPKRSRLDPEIQKQNEMLKARYSISSYPTLLLLDIHGNVKAKLSYQSGQSPSQWVQMADARLSAGSSGTPGTIRR